MIHSFATEIFSAIADYSVKLLDLVSTTQSLRKNYFIIIITN